MKFPIGFTFVNGFFTYEVIGYDENTERPYQVRFGFSKEDEDSNVIDMTEGELEVSSDLGV
ncbi:hypothetical protein PQE66_gp062 [Bacillus phage PBC2]|uniref:Uncharacterized protein n=1 Tax=Bacillus phage PBC2 TaxID=1675029 RepID=A0A218KBV6_9CAUD|nr:hypothetical protein PQE66_gp062 [Bacillus phage PBC2]AKQ08377.1 hypothetical protein PBC2_062 [Bacillus phage PBC2]MDS7057173.1 hypothetical protein [Klebsiella pneumoniae]MDS7714443.1 hypothetical protein [Klebsiella pneumoniae]